MDLLESNVTSNGATGVYLSASFGNISECNIASNSGNGITLASDCMFNITSSSVIFNTETGLAISGLTGLAYDLEVTGNKNGLKLIFTSPLPIPVYLKKILRKLFI